MNIQVRGVDLTNRETQVLELFCQGKSTKETAVELGLSPKTVEYFRFRLYDKLSPTLRSDLELVARGARMGLGLLSCGECGEALERVKPQLYRGFCNKSCYDQHRYRRVRKRKIEQAKARQNQVIAKAHSLGLSLAGYLRSLKVGVAAGAGLLFFCVVSFGQSMLMPPMPKAASAAMITHCASVELAWDPDAQSVAGYNLYYGGASCNYTNMLSAGNSTNITVQQLIIGATYYFAVTAYDSIGLESPYSAELAYTIPKPVAKPVTNVWHFLCVGATNMQFSSNLPPHWSLLGTNRVDLTNPAAPMGWYRGVGTTNTVTNWVTRL